ncbi:MAG: hypothetical protein EOO45_28060, partial [Flavobacterium sp.]
MAKMIRTKFYILLFLLATVTAFGQQKPVKASIDSTKIRIGSQFNLSLKTSVDTGATVSFPEGKNFGRLEVLESYPVDTVRKGAIYELVKKYGLTQFDSGRYVIPQLPVVINNKRLLTDSLSIEVANIQVDTIKQQMFDIKTVVAAKSSSTWWIWLLVVLALAGIGFGIFWYLKNRKKTVKETIVYTTPIEKATAHLRSLEKKGFLEKGAVKDYYSELTDIARIYIEEAIHVPAMESTTSELIEAMRIAVRRKKMSLTQETFEQLEKVLRTADMVKFAKSKPMDFEIDEDRSRIEKTIVVIDKSIPEEVPDEESNTAAWEEQQRRKKKRKRRDMIIAAGVAVVVFAGVYIATGNGLGYLRDSVLGAPTKELLEGKWVTSEYGEPPMKIETPKVLKRYNEEQIQNNLPPNVKSLQKFVYGALADNFSIVLSTTKFKDTLTVDAEA